MSRIRSLQIVVLALLVIHAFYFFVGQGNSTIAINFGKFSKRVTGTFLSIDGKETILLQINQDGNLTAIFSSQFSGGALNDPFSNSFGAWSRTGKREITAQVLDITFLEDSGEIIGVGSAQYFLTFNKTFQSAKFRCQGAIFSPGVDPFDPDSVPINGSEFTCGDKDLVFNRILQPQPDNLPQVPLK